MAKVLVTGAAGFIGSHVVERFRKAGWEVRATDMPQADLAIARAAGAECLPSDVTDPASLGPVMAGMEAVVHTAAIFNFAVPWDLIRKVNVEGTTNVARAAAEAGVKRFVEFSSVAVYGEPTEIPCPETAPKRPRNFYERTKWSGEEAAFAFDGRGGMRVTALRPTLVYGPRSRYGHAIYLGLMTLAAQAGMKRIVGYRGGPMCHHVHVEDVAAAALLLATHPGAVGQSFNVADDTPITGELFLRTLAGQCGVEVGRTLPFSFRTMRLAAWLLKHRPGRTLLERRRARTKASWKRLVERRGLTPALEVGFDTDWIDYFYCDTVYDTAKIKALGFAPDHPRFVDGIAEVTKWYREQKWLPEARTA